MANNFSEISEPLSFHYPGTMSDLMVAKIEMARALKRFLIAKRRGREQPLSQSTATASLSVTRVVAVTSDDLKVTVHSGKRKRDLVDGDNIVGGTVKKQRNDDSTRSAESPVSVIAPRCYECNEKDKCSHSRLCKVIEARELQEKQCGEPRREWRPFGRPPSPSLAIAPKNNTAKPVATIRPILLPS